MNQIPTNEIDFFESAANGMLLIKRNKALFLISVLIGVISSILFRELTPQQDWSGDATFSTSLLTNEECKPLMLEYSYKYRRFSYTLTRVESATIINVTARASSPTNLMIIQDSLINFLNKSNIAILKRKIEKNNSERALAKIERELALIDEERLQLNKIEEDLHRVAVELFEKKITYENALENLKSIRVINAFKPTNSSSFQWMLNISIGFVLGLVLAFIVIGVRAFNSRLKQNTIKND